MGILKSSVKIKLFITAIYCYLIIIMTESQMIYNDK